MTYMSLKFSIYLYYLPILIIIWNVNWRSKSIENELNYRDKNYLKFCILLNLLFTWAIELVIDMSYNWKKKWRIIVGNWDT